MCKELWKWVIKIYFALSFKWNYISLSRFFWSLSTCNSFFILIHVRYLWHSIRFFYLMVEMTVTFKVNYMQWSNFLIYCMRKTFQWKICSSYKSVCLTLHWKYWKYLQVNSITLHFNIFIVASFYWKNIFYRARWICYKVYCLIDEINCKVIHAQQESKVIFEKRHRKNVMVLLNLTKYKITKKKKKKKKERKKKKKRNLNRKYIYFYVFPQFSYV